MAMDGNNPGVAVGVIHQWDIDAEDLRTICGLSGYAVDVDGYYSRPDIVSCPACLRKLQAGYLDKVAARYRGATSLEQYGILHRTAQAEAQAQTEAPKSEPTQVEIAGVVGDPNTLFQPEPPKRPLTEQGLMMLGIQFPEGRQPTHEIERHLGEQAAEYGRFSKEQLIEELIRRDRNAIVKGQEIAEGKTAGKLLREFVRGILYQADEADRQVIQNELHSGRGTIDTILKLMGAEPTPKRDLRLNGGTTLGNINQAPPDQPETLEDWQRTTPRADVAQDIRENASRVQTVNEQTRGDEEK